MNIKRNDTAPPLDATLEVDGEATSVAGATVRFHMRDRDGVTVIDAAATVVDGAAGEVRYSWQAGDTATAGRFQGEFEVTYGDGLVRTFPDPGYIVIDIDEDIA